MGILCSKFRRPEETSTTQLDRVPNLNNTINNLIPPPPSSSPPIHPTQASTSSGHNGMPVQAVELPQLPQQQHRGHPITTTASFGIDHAFKQVSDFLSDEDVGGVGIYGMGGVGKTTLMERIHQEFLLQQGFRVIWITVSKTINVDKVQQVIMKEMGLEFDPDEEHYNRAQSISRKLKEEVGRVALLLDDIWKFVDLKKVLGPVNPSIFKIVFTTRLQRVCKQMKPHKEIKMECLGWDDSWALFEKTVGREAIYDCDFRIAEVAKDIAKECKGLPLALIVIGRAIAGMCSVEEWKSALSTLGKSPSEYAEEDLFSRLKFSYDKLPTQMAKDCFLHCCSFPEDSSIPSEKLIEFWMGEGLLGLHRSYVEARNKGYEIIGTLEAACLLEKRRLEVKMHDVIREMGLWIICDDKLNFIIDSGISFSNEEIAERWMVARRIFILKKSTLPEQPTCRNLLALLQSEFTIEQARISVPNVFFESMHGLRVLHLVDVDFDGFPEAIGTLSELRYLYIRCSNLIRLPEEIRKLSKLMVLRLEDNEDLRELPSTIGQLAELRKLVLNTGPKELPEGFTKLNKLDVLELGRPERCMERFPASFAEMVGLRILNLHVTNFDILPAGLWEMTKLENLSIFCDGRNQAASVGSLGQLCGLQTLRVTCLPRDAIKLSKTRFPFLTELEIRRCTMLEEIRIGKLLLPNLHILGIFGCRSLHQIHGFHHLQGLVELRVVHCLVKELFSEKGNFLKLKVLELHRMSKLNIICDDSVRFPSLSEFSLSDCPNLKKLPLGLMNENRSLKICSIMGGQSWLDGLSWQNDEFKSFLQPRIITVRHISNPKKMEAMKKKVNEHASERQAQQQLSEPAPQWMIKDLGRQEQQQLSEPAPQWMIKESARQWMIKELGRREIKEFEQLSEREQQQLSETPPQWMIKEFEVIKELGRREQQLSEQQQQQQLSELQQLSG